MLTTLSQYTTLQIGGKCNDFHLATTENQLITLVQEADLEKIPVVVIGGGSNIYFSDSGFSGRVIKNAILGNSYEIDACSGGMLTVAAGEDWERFVKFTLDKGLANLESMSGIPGTVGAAPIQNIGAYGHEVGELIARVRTFDRTKNEIETFTNSQLDFSYRDSFLKKNLHRYIVLDVTFHLRKGELSLPINYQELANKLQVKIGDRATTNLVREKVLELRSQKGMLLSSNLKSAGSFFTNPIVDGKQLEKLPKEAVHFPYQDKYKISAAWLIENSGFSKGDIFGNVGISPLHVLALINLGNASASELNKLAREITNKVRDKFGVEINREVFELG